MKIKGLKISHKIPGNTLSDALLKSRIQKIAADATKSLRSFFWRESRKKMMCNLNFFCQERWWKGLTTFASCNKTCVLFLLYILKLGFSPEIPTQYSGTRIIARDSHTKRLKSEVTEKQWFCVLKFPLSPLHARPRRRSDLKYLDLEIYRRSCWK